MKGKGGGGFKEGGDAYMKEEKKFFNGGRLKEKSFHFMKTERSKV